MFGDCFYGGRIICIERIELQRSDFRFAVAERRREFSSVVSRDFYNTFVLVRDGGLCLFGCIKATGSQQTTS